MRNCSLTITILIFLLAGKNSAFSQARSEEKVVFVTDRSSCISGDTIWVNTYLATTEDQNFSRIIHMQLDGLSNRHITKSIIRADRKKGVGYIVVPDSLSTGTYLLKAFTNQQKGYSKSQVASQFLIVYNRFADNLENVITPAPGSINTKNTNHSFHIKTIKPEYGTRDKVSIEFSIPDSLKGQIADLTICTRYIDPLAKSLNTGNLFYEPSGEKIDKIYTIENNGITVNGRIVDAQSSEPVSEASVLLSISDSIPYFDYYYSDNDGSFRFYLKETWGTADLVLQAIAKNKESYRIELFDNYITTSEHLQTENRILTIPQREAIGDLLKSGRFERYFSPPVLNSERKFIKPPRFIHPFYGKPTTTVYTQDYIDLPNFQEISRELLTSSKYREKKDTVILKLINEEHHDFFESEPLKMLDGIPIFDVRMLSEKSSLNIERIDVVAEERMFGDMIFHGVIAVYSPEYNLGWVNNQPNMKRFDFQTIQMPLDAENHTRQKTQDINIPDFRKTLLWKRIKNRGKLQNTSFVTSDLKGTFEIVLTAVNENGSIITESTEIIVN